MEKCMDKKREEGLLSSFMENGLVLDVDKCDALSFLRLFTSDEIMEYASYYGVADLTGELVFVPGTSFSSLRRDILFDKELSNLVTASTAVLLCDMERKIDAVDSSIYSPLGKRTLEDIWFDYNNSFKSSLKSSLSSFYSMDEDTFSFNLETISYASERAREGRRLIDYIFPDCDESLSPFMPSDRIAYILLTTENMLSYSMRPLSFPLIGEVKNLLLRYDIAPGRVGLIDFRSF